MLEYWCLWDAQELWNLLKLTFLNHNWTYFSLIYLYHEKLVFCRKHSGKILCMAFVLLTPSFHWLNTLERSGSLSNIKWVVNDAYNFGPGICSFFGARNLRYSSRTKCSNRITIRVCIDTCQDIIDPHACDSQDCIFII